MNKPPKKLKKRVSRKNATNAKQARKGGAIHGLIGLELTALRKTFDGQTKYNFDQFLKDSIPDDYKIEILKISQKYEETREALHPVKGSIECHSFEELQKSLVGNYNLNLVDHGSTTGDLLSESRFTKTHERNSKHEKKFTTEDKQKLASEVDNSIELLSILGIDLKRTTMKETLENLSIDDIELNDDQMFRLSQILGTITHINDPTDTSELILKYKLTVRELQTFLLNSLRIKSLENVLKKRIDNEDFQLFDAPTKTKEEVLSTAKTPCLTSDSDKLTENKPTKKHAPKFKVTLKITNFKKFKEIVDRAPKILPKKRGPYKKRVKQALTVDPTFASTDISKT